MKYLGTKVLSRLSAFLMLVCLSVLSTAHARELVDFNSNWRFAEGAHSGAEQIDFDDSHWQSLRLPHDWAIAGPFDPDADGDTGKLPWRGEGWYRKEFKMDNEYQGKRIYFIFDGIMSFPKVYINGQLAGEWDYGYNSFYLDVTDALRFGQKNLIAIYATTNKQRSRWYPGGGIYRKISMLAVEPTHVAVWGTYVTTPEVRDTWADVRVVTTLKNADNDNALVEIAETIISPAGGEVAAKSQQLTLPAGAEKNLESLFTLTRPERWDVDNPALYTLYTVIKRDNREVDRYKTNFGVRTFRFTANDGFWLNGRRLHLKGVNLHHDHGPLGAVFLPRAMERQLEIMREMGVNAIRTSHNTPAPELAGMTDRMGLLLFNELFDKWDDTAAFDSKSMDFDEYFERQTRNFITRDRNHPSVFLWSVGNEIGDVQRDQKAGRERLRKVTGYFRKYDPSRPITMVCDAKDSVHTRHFDFYDVHNWNYGRRYLPARKMDPGKAVIISESASTVSTRGYYNPDLPANKTDFVFDQPYQVSSYDMNAPEWAEPADDDFLWQEEDTYVAGEFVWTGFDYIGEPTPYNDYWAKEAGRPQTDVSRSSYFGIVDLCGFPKDRYYLYRSYWRPDDTTVHLLPHWNWAGQEGRKIPVFVYTNGDRAELFLNGKSLGFRKKNPKSDIPFERYRLMWNEVSYQPGTLKAVAYKEGRVIGEALVHTAGAPKKLALSADRRVVYADGDDLAYITIEAIDGKGNVAPLADNLVTLKIEGPAILAGVGNGDPRGYNGFQAEKVPLFNGKALLILRTIENKSGKIRITAKADGLSNGKVVLHSQATDLIDHSSHAN
jgi:beta-galactosidase